MGGQVRKWYPCLKGWTNLMFRYVHFPYIDPSILMSKVATRKDTPVSGNSEREKNF